METKFGRTLKKFVNSLEKLKLFLERKIEKKINRILRLISGGETLLIKASDGSRLIYQAKQTFNSYLSFEFTNWGLTKKGIATKETEAYVYEIAVDANFVKIFKSLPGSWNQKWLSQNQIIDFCEQLPNWLRAHGNATFFLCKIDEARPINEKKPQDNLVVVSVNETSVGWSVYVRRLENGAVWRAELRHRVVVPRIQF